MYKIRPLVILLLYVFLLWRALFLFHSFRFIFCLPFTIYFTHQANGMNHPFHLSSSPCPFNNSFGAVSLLFFFHFFLSSFSTLLYIMSRTKCESCVRALFWASVHSRSRGTMDCVLTVRTVNNFNGMTTKPDLKMNPKYIIHRTWLSTIC